MRKISAIIAVMAVIAIAIIPLIPDVSSDDAGASIGGFIKINNKFTADEDLVITVYCPNTTENGYDKYISKGLDENGYFQVDGIPSKEVTKCYISFVVNAYTVDNWTKYVDHVPDYDVSPGTACYRFTSEMEDASFVPGKLYVISDEYETIIMTSSYGSITGRVITDSATPVALNGATISVKDSDGSVIKRANSSSGGYFTVNDCPTGTYSISIEMTGYEMYTNSVHVGKGSTTDLREIQLHASDAWFGLDLSHTLAIIGGAIAIVLIVLGGFLLYMRRKGKCNFIRGSE